MDFSSVPRALESLIRRQPPVDGAILEACYHLKDLFSSPCQVDEEGVEPPPLVAPGEVALSALTVLLRHDTRWEALAVGLCTSTTLLAGQRPSSVYVEGPRVPEIVPSSAALASRVGGIEAARGHDATTNPNVVPSIHKSTDDNGLDGAVVVQLSPEQAHLLCQHVHRVCLKHLDHGEPRVRTLVAKSIPAYLCWNPQDVEREYAQELYGRLVASIRQHLEEGRDTLRGEHSKSSAGALDDTTGWRALETNWLCLKALIHALIQSHYYRILPLESTVLEDCRHSAVSHVSRHIRAAAMHALEQWILAAAATADPDQSHSLLQDPSSPLRQTTVAVLRSGMADNWSQVRMAASVLCRVFLTTLQQQSSSVSTVEQPARTPPLEWLKAHSDVCSVVLPRLCLNRYYSAHGVKLYSHETWVTIVHDRGIDIVAQSLPAFVRYDIQMCDADSHSVREAACQALAELVRRLGSHDTYRDQFANHIEPILQALVVCFHDESWPVRDEAGLACAVLCKSYPDLCRSELKLLWDRWTEQLTDQVWSVRQRAAVALGDVVEGYPELWSKLLELVRKLLPSARHEPPMTQEAYRAHQDEAAHRYRPTNGRVLGCMDCIIDRPKAPWEATDGCIYMIQELTTRGTVESSPNPMTDDILLPLLKELADVCRVQHFPQGDDLRATLWRQLPLMAQALGKDRFKRHYLDLFLDLLFHTLDSRSASQLSIHAAGQCAEALSSLVGVNIFRGRLEDSQRAVFDQVLRERAQAPKGPGDDSGYAHLGPPDLFDAIHQKRFAAVPRSAASAATAAVAGAP